MTRGELMAVVRATGCAIECGGSVFLRDPHWPDAERARAEILMSEARDRTAPLAEGWLCVRTGGSSGGVQFARHDESTLSAAAHGFAAHFGLERVNAVDVLPAHHVSGLMARVRCAASGGVHCSWDWKRVEQGDRPDLERMAGKGQDAKGWVISLVPTQLHRLMDAPRAVDWLRGFHAIFLGGGPTWAALADQAMAAGLRISLSYGMTETAAMVAALRPEEFLAGDRSCGAPLPHARVRMTGDGRLAVGGDSLFRGYFGRPPQTGEFLTEDLGRIDERGHIHVLGRRDAVIITGGKKVHPAEVEAVLRATGEFVDIAVIGVMDPTWGQAVVAFYPASGKPPDLERAVAGLAGFQRPKRFVGVGEWPRTASGKIDRLQLARMATATAP